jgi:hypothetical protein
MCAYFDYDVAALYEGNALPELADAHELARGAALNNVDNLRMVAINVRRKISLTALTCKPSLDSLTPIPSGKRLFGQVVM